MTAVSPVDEVVGLLRELRLPHMRGAAPDLLATAKAQRWDPAEAVRALLAEELAGRQASSINARRKAAGFPTGKTFDAWDESISSIPAPTQRALRTLEWLERHENVVVCGPSGTGKSHFLEALGHWVVSWIWLEQALAAQAALGRAGLAEADRHFYLGKLQAARWFLRWELPRVAPMLDLLDSLDTSTLEMRDAWF